jgi:hypothetical protein
MTLPSVTLPSGNPGHILGACKRAALKERWLLEQWTSFREAAMRAMTPDAHPDEHERFMAVVRAHFTVTLGPMFSADPSQWRAKPEVSTP